MSNMSIAGAAAALPKVTFQLHGRHRGVQAGADQSLGGRVGPLPPGAAPNLHANPAHTLKQPPAAPTAAAAGAAAALKPTIGGKLDISA